MKRPKDIYGNHKTIFGEERVKNDMGDNRQRILSISSNCSKNDRGPSQAISKWFSSELRGQSEQRIATHRRGATATMTQSSDPQAIVMNTPSKVSSTTTPVVGAARPARPAILHEKVATEKKDFQTGLAGAAKAKAQPNVPQDADTTTVVSMSDCESRTARSLSQSPPAFSNTNAHRNSSCSISLATSSTVATAKSSKGPSNAIKKLQLKRKALSSNSSSQYSHCDSLRPILVGYAFGPKKMSTMSVVMAEASMAVSTVVTHISPRFEKRKRRKLNNPNQPSSAHNNQQHQQQQQQQHTDENVCKPEDSQSLVLNKRSKQTINDSNTEIDEDDDCCSIDTYAEVDSIISMSCATTASTINDTTSTNAVSCIFPKSTCPSICSSTNNTGANVNNINANTSITSNSFPGTYIQIPQHYQRMRVSFVPLDLNSPLEEQHGGKFDAILHKMTEDILSKSQLSETSSRCVDELLFPSSSSSATTSTTNGISTEKLEKSEEEAMKRIQRLLKYKHDHPACFLADHPTNVEAVMNRSKIAETLTQCLRGIVTKSGIAVRTPRYLVLDENNIGHNCSDTSIAQQIEDAPFTYPLIIKPLTAAGTAESHRMGILLGRKGIPKIQHTPCLLQEYANHDGILYKVYVLGSRVWVFSRPSLPNLPIGELVSSDLAHYVDFDSQRPYPKISDFGVVPHNNSVGAKCVESSIKGSNGNNINCNSNHLINNMTCDEIRPVADCIRRAFGLELFGFDVLVTKNNTTKEMFVVDVNYFPSYKEVTNFSELLAQYLAQCGIEGRVRSLI